jgi:hypothetical protein
MTLEFYRKFQNLGIGPLLIFKFREKLRLPLITPKARNIEN